MAIVALLPFLNMGRERRWPRWIKKASHIGSKRLCHGRIAPRYIAVRHKCSVHFKFGIFTYNGHNRSVNFSMNSTEKMLSYQNCIGSFLLTFGFPWCIWYSPVYDTSNTPMHIICSWMMVNNDWKIADIMLFLGSTIGNIHSKYAIVYLWISFALDCIYWLASLTQR